MKRFGLFTVIVVLAALAGKVSAQEYFYPNGVFVGVDVKASFMHREKKIAYGLWSPNVEISPTEIRDVTVSPSLTLGYKLNNDNSISVRADWASYSVKRSVSNNGSLGCGFGVLTIDGITNLGDCTTPAAASMKWDSDVVNTELEYQRRIWSDELGGVLGLLGFSYRFEGQTFKGQGGTVNGLVDTTKETLDEHLFGPYGGLKVSFKPYQGSNLNFNLKSTVGYYFQSASGRAREVLFGTPLSGNDRSSRGTVFFNAGANATYAIMRNLSLGLDYRFNWINQAAHIQNPTLGNFQPTRIGTSAILDHRIGLDLTYHF